MPIHDVFAGILADRAAVSLIVFGMASALWALTRLNATLVGLLAAGILVAVGAVPPADLAGIATSDIIRLMIGAFVLGEAIIASGLATRLTSLILARARRVDQLFWLTAAAMALLTFLVPSTSGRAAVALPLFRALSGLLDEAAVRGLALLIPIIVLTTTIAALTGAGSHLIANDMLHAASLDPVGYGAWTLNGLPFALAAGGLSTVAVIAMTLTPQGRRANLVQPPSGQRSWTAAERRVASVATAMVLLWLTSAWHGLPMGGTALLGAAALIWPARVIGLRQATRATNWDLVGFMIAALVLAHALLATGAAGRLVAAAEPLLTFAGQGGPTAALAAISAICLASHLVMTSHAARAATLVPPIIAIAPALSLDPVAAVFMATVAMNYCLTLPVSSKALMLYQSAPGGFSSRTLLRLSAVLAPAHLILILAFAATWWRWTGLIP
jgi:di/tricarboxylate transporter